MPVGATVEYTGPLAAATPRPARRLLAPGSDSEFVASVVWGALVAFVAFLLAVLVILLIRSCLKRRTLKREARADSDAPPKPPTREQATATGVSAQSVNPPSVLIQTADSPSPRTDTNAFVRTTRSSECGTTQDHHPLWSNTSAGGGTAGGGTQAPLTPGSAPSSDTLSSMKTDFLSGLPLALRGPDAPLRGAAGPPSPSHPPPMARHSPAAVHEQLDAIGASGVLLWGRYCLLSSSRRVTSQGITQLVVLEDGASATWDGATAIVKLFLDPERFRAEWAIYKDIRLRSLHPPILDILPNAEGRTAVLGRPLPPLIAVPWGTPLEKQFFTGVRDVLACARAVLRIAERLSLLHRHGLAHRDLTPASLSVFDVPPRDYICVTDFAFAAPIGTWAPVCVSDGYTAPEIVAAKLRGESEVLVDTAADVWALGVIAFELLTQTRAFPSSATETCSSGNDLGGRLPEPLIQATTGASPMPWEAAAHSQHLSFMREGILLMLQREPSRRAALPVVLHLWTQGMQGSPRSGSYGLGSGYLPTDPAP